MKSMEKILLTCWMECSLSYCWILAIIAFLLLVMPLELHPSILVGDLMVRYNMLLVVIKNVDTSALFLEGLNRNNKLEVIYVIVCHRICVDII